jgi:hypothetical protein
VEIHAHVPKLGKTAVHWLLEGALIVVSVLLAFAVGEWREARTEHELKERVLRGITQEIEGNLKQLEPFVAMHAQWLDAIDKATPLKPTDTALDVMFATRPALPTGSVAPFPALRRSAWDAAIAGGTMRLIDYDLASSLADVYRIQDIATGNVQRLASGPLSSITTYDPASRPAAVRLMLLTLADIQSAEASLLKLYRQHLPHVRAASAE